MFVRVSSVVAVFSGSRPLISVYVINLPGATTRWQNFAASQSAHAPQFRLVRVEAIAGNSTESKFSRPSNYKEFVKCNGRVPLATEIGCYQSHLKALRTFLESDDPFGLISEDDVVFEPDSAARIEAILRDFPDLSVVKLVNHRASLFVSLGRTDAGDDIGRTLIGPQGSAAAYLVSRNGARKLLSKLTVMSAPWDVALEAFWDHGASVFSTRHNVLCLSEQSLSSSIAPQGYGGTKLPLLRRIGAGFWRSRNAIRRLINTIGSPEESDSTTLEATTKVTPHLPIWGEILIGLLVISFVSAVWLESDVYRFSGLILVGLALYRYLKFDFWNYGSRITIGWMATLTISWALYVLMRILLNVLDARTVFKGSAEGIYIFPLFYVSLSYALIVYVRRPFIIVSMFIVLSVIFLGVGIDFQFGANSPAVALLQNNSIHAAIGAGIILLCTIPFAVHVLTRQDLKLGWQMLLGTLAALTFLIALIAVYALRSKGVWLALLCSLPVLAISMVATESGRRRRLILFVVALFIGFTCLVSSPMLGRVAAPAIHSATVLMNHLISGEGIFGALSAAIADPATPANEKERMMLWYNSLHIWRSNFFFGAGVFWIDYWQHRPYKETVYTLLHNGFLEIAVRYGLAGLLFYMLLFGWCLQSVWQAAKKGVIDRAAFQCYVSVLVFFACTLLSNSNNRLAIGESYMWFASSFGFYSYYALQLHRRR